MINYECLYIYLYCTSKIFQLRRMYTTHIVKTSNTVTVMTVRNGQIKYF